MRRREERVGGGRGRREEEEGWRKGIGERRKWERRGESLGRRTWKREQINEQEKQYGDKDSKRG